MSDLWSLLEPGSPADDLTAAVDGHPLVAQLLAQRGFTTPDAARAFLDPAAYTPASPTALLGVEHAAHLLKAAIDRKQRILVWGDFDVDGQTSTSLLVAALRRLAGDERVLFHVPNRFTESHGIRLEKLRAKLDDPSTRPDLILTCDTGITDGEAIGYAKDAGVAVVVTDHHDLPPDLQGLDPAVDAIWGGDAAEVGAASVRRADAIVNPKLQGPDDPLRSLPGVGVAFKLIQHLYTLCGLDGEEETLLDLVALGIVADVAEQVNDARYLLQLGLAQLRRTRRTGLLALMEIARVTPADLDAESIGFQIGPRMNALGRLDDATVAVELLTTRDPIRAGQLAGKMERLNQRRRVLTSQITAAALEMIERRPSLLDFNGLVLAHPAWHAGIVGIVASRLVEQFRKPTVLLLTPPGEPARGSARSIPGVDIGSAIAGCSRLLLSHGGHPGAAGLSLLPENIDRFRAELDLQIELHRAPETREPTGRGLIVDAELPWTGLNLALAEQVQRLAPFGNGNPTPQFLTSGLTVDEDRRLGRDGDHRRLLMSKDGVQFPVLWFNSRDAELRVPSGRGALDLVYTLGINTFRGERALQLNFVAGRATPATPTATRTEDRTQRVPAPGRACVLHDLRQTDLSATKLPTPIDAVWYAEGTRLDTAELPVSYAPRFAAAERGAGDLVIYTAPPSAALVRWLVAAVQPREVFLVAKLTCDDSLEGVLRAVGSMCKYALGRDGRLALDRMAARLGATEAVVRHSLLWLESRGQITVLDWSADNGVLIAAGDVNAARSAEDAALLQAQLSELLAEARAFRRYFRRAPLTELGFG